MSVVDQRVTARDFIYQFEDTLHKHGEAAALDYYKEEAAKLETHKENAYFLIAFLRVPYRMRNEIPDYWDIFKKIYDWLSFTRTEEEVHALLVGLVGEAKLKGAIAP